jgi:hypothetical protein
MPGNTDPVLPERYPAPSILLARICIDHVQISLFGAASMMIDTGHQSVPNGGYFASSLWWLVTQSDVMLGRRVVSSGWDRA